MEIQKTNKLIINSIDDLIKLGKSNVLKPKQFIEIIQSCQPFVGIFLHEYKNTIEMAEILNENWIKWKKTSEKPIFLDFTLSNDDFLK